MPQPRRQAADRWLFKGVSTTGAGRHARIELQLQGCRHHCVHGPPAAVDQSPLPLHTRIAIPCFHDPTACCLLARLCHRRLTTAGVRIFLLVMPPPNCRVPHPLGLLLSCSKELLSLLQHMHAVAQSLKRPRARGLGRAASRGRQGSQRLPHAAAELRRCKCTSLCLSEAPGSSMSKSLFMYASL